MMSLTSRLATWAAFLSFLAAMGAAVALANPNGQPPAKQENNERPDQNNERPDQNNERPDQNNEKPDQNNEKPDQNNEKPKKLKKGEQPKTVAPAPVAQAPASSSPGVRTRSNVQRRHASSPRVASRSSERATRRRTASRRSSGAPTRSSPGVSGRGARQPSPVRASEGLRPRKAPARTRAERKPAPRARGQNGVITRIVEVVPPEIQILLLGIGALAVLFGVATLATGRRLADAESRAATDALTGLPNHCAVHEELGRRVEQAERKNAPLSVVLLDLDNFKRVNDSYGHLKGDQVLKAVGNRMRDELRGRDFVGRYGGEEFVAILPGSDRDGAVTVVDRLRRNLWDVEVPGVRELVTASLGVAAFPEDGKTPNQLLESADEALYVAKAGGRNQVQAAISRSDEDRMPQGTGPRTGWSEAWVQLPATNGAASS
jgi:diguanylate cyclase (GGDEF)-like protein